MKNKEDILSKMKEQAIICHKAHKKEDPYTKIALWFPNSKESRLLEVSLRFDSIETENVLICRYANEELAFPSALMLLSYNEYKYYMEHKSKFKEQSKGWDLNKAQILAKEIEDNVVLDQNEKIKIHIDSALYLLDSAKGALMQAKEESSKDVFDKYIEKISNTHKDVIDNFVGKNW